VSPFVVLERRQHVFDLLKLVSSLHSENLVAFIAICTSTTPNGGCGRNRGNKKCAQEARLHGE
jgi:hypothetical protein